MEINYSSRFEKDFRKLPSDIQKRALERESWFQENPFDTRLKTHPLKGPLDGLHSFSINGSYRIIFKFNDGKSSVWFLRVGTHDIYDYH